MSSARGTDHIDSTTIVIDKINVQIQSGFGPDDNRGLGTGRNCPIAEAWQTQSVSKLAQVLALAKLRGEPIAGDLFFGEEGWFGARIIEHSNSIIIRWALKENCPFQIPELLFSYTPNIEESTLRALFKPVG